MNSNLFLILITFFFLMGLLGCTNQTSQKTKNESSLNQHEDPEGYYTCSMHPQVHEHKSGKCPICGMELIKVSSKPPQTKDDSAREYEIPVTDKQLALAGIGKYTVSKKDLTFIISVSGRLVSSREVAFQIYESDLQSVVVGLDFNGYLGASTDETLSGQIRSVDNLVDPSSRTVRVVGTLHKTPRRVVVDSGFYGEIKVIKKSQIFIPEEAVLHAGKRDLIYLITKENKFKSSSVILGSKVGREYQVLSGLEEGDIISTGPNFLIDSEAKIRGGND